MKSFTIKCAAFLVALLLLSSCSNDNKPTGPGNVVTLYFVGTVNGDNGSLSGSISFTVNGTTVTGILKVVTPAVDTQALTGTYNTGTKALNASGGGYTFSGVFDGTNRLEGSMSGTASGTFVTTKDDNNSNVAFCGTFTGSDDGVWNFTIDGTSIVGSYTTSSGSVGALDGTISSNSITINNPGGGAPLATGTRSGDNASGTWDNGAGSSGTWTGSRCN